ncbi:MAG: orotidine-5'-phosphate decarboxylase, partial [Actinobacteria bacterium]|nr:orotidine-5'-phosphate decarboxylase [Actinomycetota bacterium]
MSFYQRLNAAWDRSGSMLCVGLDPDVSRFPTSMRGSVNAIEDFCKAIVDATGDLVCAFKPQIAYFAAVGAEKQLENICEYIRAKFPDVVLILDAKRGDIGDTASLYAREAFLRYGADAVTVNPYLGTDSLEPFLKTPGKGTIVLCRTSNAGSSEFQSLEVDGEPVYLRVARTAAAKWRLIGECALVVGATYPDELAQVRAIVGNMPILVPGIGAQGGDINAVVRAGATRLSSLPASHATTRSGSSATPNPTFLSIGPSTASQLDSKTRPSNANPTNRRGLIINSSRAILYASDGANFATAARDVALA